MTCLRGQRLGPEEDQLHRARLQLTPCATRSSDDPPDLDVRKRDHFDGIDMHCSGMALRSMSSASVPVFKAISASSPRAPLTKDPGGTDYVTCDGMSSSPTPSDRGPWGHNRCRRRRAGSLPAREKPDEAPERGNRGAAGIDDESDPHHIERVRALHESGDKVSRLIQCWLRSATIGCPAVGGKALHGVDRQRSSDASPHRREASGGGQGRREHKIKKAAAT